jgi:uncharacterized membrane protein YqjE
MIVNRASASPAASVVDPVLGGAMTPGEQPRGRENALTLVRRLVSGVVDLAKLEVQRGRQELTENVITYRTGVVFLAIALAFAVLMGIVLMILLVFIISELTGVRPWIIALLFVVLLAALAGIFAWQGVRRIQAAKFTPDETIEAVKEDIEWAKRLLRRG